MKKISIVGYQTASLENLIFSLRENKKKIDYFPKSFFSKMFIYKKCNNIKKKDKNILERIFKNKKIIVGTSETYLEANIIEELNKRNLHFYSYVDSPTRIAQRFKKYSNFPLCYIVNHKIIKFLLNKLLKKKKKYIIKNLNLLYPKLLKKKFGNIKKKNRFFLYLTSNLGFKIELKFIMMLLKLCKIFNKKLIILIHPRESLTVWKEKMKDSMVKIYQKNVFYFNKNIKYVFGMQTMGLINYKYAGFHVNYFDSRFSDKNLTKIFSETQIKLLKLKNILKNNTINRYFI